MRPTLALVMTLVGTVLIWAPRVFDLAVLVVWNASASAPIGLYRVSPAGQVNVGDRVLVDPEAADAALLSRRGYVPKGVPLIKTVAAVGPSRVCREGQAITIGGRLAAHARAADRHGRPLPAWSGCRVLDADHVFLLTPDVPDSFDGRYFGPTRMTAVRARVMPVWTRRARA